MPHRPRASGPSLPPPPVDHELVDYFLFELKKGYCDYYATSMVVLARAAGIPARLAIGYLPGTFEPVQNAYIVTEADAHSWVEVYFPGFGWVDFEPTGGRPSIVRGGSPVRFDSPDLNEFMLSIDRDQARPSERFDQSERKPQQLLWLVPAAAALALGLLVIIQRWRVRQMPLAEAANRIFDDLMEQAKRMGLTIYPGTTASELSVILSSHLSGIRQPAQLARWLRTAPAEVAYLSESYSRLMYDRPTQYSRLKKVDLLQSWRRLRWRLWLAWFAGIRDKLNLFRAAEADASTPGTNLNAWRRR